MLPKVVANKDFGCPRKELFYIVVGLIVHENIPYLLCTRNWMCSGQDAVLVNSTKIAGV